MREERNSWSGRRTLASVALAAAFLPAGCAGRPAPEPRIVEPGASDLSYVLALHASDPIRVTVTLEFDGAPGGKTTLEVEERWASVEHPGREIVDFAVRDSGGRALAMAHPDDDSWVVVHEPLARLTATWTLFQPESREPIAGNEFRTRSTADWFQMIGILGLVYPAHLDRSEEHDRPPRTRLEWRGFAERGLATACSHGVGPGPFLVERPLPAFRNAVFLAGKLRLQERDVPGGRLAVAVAGDDWGFTDREFTDCVARIIGIEREFAGGRAIPGFVVTLVPQGPRRTDQAFFVGGTGLTSSFALYSSPGLTLAPGSADRRQLLHILAHEHFHTLGRRGAEQPEELVYWFGEGFTDFYTRRLLFRSGLWTLDDYVRDLNGSLEQLWLGRGRNSTNEEVRRATWKDAEIAGVAGQRGDVLALVLDHELRARSGGRRSLDDFMRPILAGEGAPFTCDALLDLVAEATDADFAARVRQTVVDGADPPLRDDVAAPVLRLAFREVRPLVPGLDVNATLEHREVRGVLEGSPAWSAGLRDGQMLLSLEVDERDGRPCRITAQGGDGTTIELDPRGPPVSVPTFEIQERDESLIRTVL